MDWARDQLGNLVNASQQGLFSYGLSCPTCGEPVRRRAGPERRPHFAHYSYRAKPECESYHPSRSTASTYGTRHVQPNEHAASSGTAFQGGIFLDRTGVGSYSLYLKLPQLPDGVGTGEIEIRSGLGVKTYTAPQLQRRRLVRVTPQFPLLDVIIRGNMFTVEAAIRNEVKSFRESGNFFRIGEAGNRLLVPDEPLEWGERYWLVTQQALEPVLEGLGLIVESERRLVA